MDQPQKKVVLRAWKADILDMVEETNPPPLPKENKALIRVEATSVQSTDLLQRLGKYPTTYFKEKPPLTLGYDFVGKIVKFPEGYEDEYKGFRIGDRVCDLCMHSAHARYIERPVDKLIRVPDGIDPSAGTTLVLSWTTAYQMLKRTKAKKVIEAGGKVFVAGGAGAVARALIVLARMKGCTVYTTAKEKNHAMLKSLGAIPFDYKKSDWVKEVQNAVGQNGVDAAFDGVMSDDLKSTLAVMRGSGNLVIYGGHGHIKQGSFIGGFAMAAIFFRVLPLMLRPDSSVEIFDISASRAKNPEVFKDDLLELFQLLKDGKIDAMVGERIDLEEIDAYHKKLRDGGFGRKIVCNPS